MNKFGTTQRRNAAAKEVLEGLLSQTSDSSPMPPLDPLASDVLRALVGSLAQDPPSASQVAEGALTILALTIVEGQKLDLSQRLAGDRSLGDWLCRDLLQAKNIPSTKGPFQSSSFRGGYTSDQVRDTGLRKFVAWYSDDDRDFEQLKAMTGHLAQEFLKHSVELSPLPEIAAAKLTFLKFALFHERLLAEGSGGAFEQYLLAGLLEQELAATGTGHRIQTKNVGANDAATKSGGDIEVRHGQVLIKGYEVTANAWSTKLAQLDSSAKAGLAELTVVAKGVSEVSAAALNGALESKAEQLGIDVAVLDLANLLDVLAARITRHARAEAVVFVYRSLARWHRRQPGLIGRLIEVLNDLDLVVAGQYVQAPDAKHADVAESMTRVNALLNELGTLKEPEIPDALRKLAQDLEADSQGAAEQR